MPPCMVCIGLRQYNTVPSSGNRIVDPNLRPRRLWDLYNNRVVLGWMFSLGVEYMWLDILCLRQEGGPKDGEEWELDVPTIGPVYFGAEVVIYPSELGLPLNVKEDSSDSERCWFRSVWTLQEIGWYRIIAGIMPNGPIHANPTGRCGNYGMELLAMFHKQLGSEKYSWHLFGHFADMRKHVLVAHLPTPSRYSKYPGHRKRVVIK
ncbi:hypothetical protein IW261DRAFT_1596768 [Armillaria novae-zelandiae]|uniref:Heterokaryon incompatibility domain-containing protein n=1 Tax=Armillaria novae-zelandiae TaxID=153914 RepID=A0AA39NVI3_9AGAR|nr:hypothetical protein IW261DRAFT_1596768 [Armillaria novae-zelandiae]